MSPVRQIRGFFRVDLLDTVRFWYVSLFTVGMTTFYYLMLSGFVDPAYRQETTLAFVILAVLGVTLFQFATRASTERLDPWNSFVRTLPAPLWVKFTARLILVMLVGSFATVLLMSAGAIRYDLSYEPATILTVVIAVPVAAAVFAPIGACVGGLLHPRFAPAVMTVIYLGTAWSSGLWSGGRPPELLGEVDFLLPLLVIRRLAGAAVAGDWATVAPNLAVASLWGVGAFALAWVIHARDQGEQFD